MIAFGRSFPRVRLSEESATFRDRPLGFANDHYPIPAGFRDGNTRLVPVVDLADFGQDDHL
jgi:hypothetical protein